MSKRFIPISREEEKAYLERRLKMDYVREDSDEDGWIRRYRGICPYCGNNQGKFFCEKNGYQYRCECCGIDKSVDQVFDHVIVTDLFWELIG